MWPLIPGIFLRCYGPVLKEQGQMPAGGNLLRRVQRIFMEKCDKLISIVTATYNMGNYLASAIESVRSQTYQKYEHIIVDDGSTDDTREIVNRYMNDPRIRYHFQENKGQAAAKNKGIKEARGEYIAFLDADNLWLDKKLERQIGFINKGSHLGEGLIHADVQMIDHKGDPIYTSYLEKYDGHVTFELLIENFVAFNTALLSKSILDDVGYFDESLSMAIDYDLWLRISVNYQFFHIPEKLVLYRIWQGQMSHNMIERFTCVNRILDNFIQNNPELLSKKQLNRIWAHHYTNRARYFIKVKDKRQSLQNLLRAAKFEPGYWFTWKSLAKLILT
jgi:glycosyltransferase involved in cell wall biosynthesis